MITTVAERGRRRVSEIPEERLRHLTALACRRFLGAKVKSIAILNQVSERRAWGWLALAKTYAEASDSDYLRSLVKYDD